jgi:hypothetical protein
MKIEWLLNPFRYIAGGKSLLYGFLAMFFATWLGTWNNVHFDGVIDVHVGAKLPFWCFYMESLLSWFVFSIILYFTGLIISSSKIRIIDIFGTQSLAKAPLILVSLICFFPMFHFQFHGLPKIDFWLVLFALICIFFTIWIIMLMYNAFSISANVKESKAIIAFIIALVLAEIISKIFIFILIKLYK